jgi:hypothetical protein
VSASLIRHTLASKGHGFQPWSGSSLFVLLTTRIVVPWAALLWGDAAAAVIEIPIHLVLIPNQYIGTDDL